MSVRFEMASATIGRLTLQGGKANSLDRPDFMEQAELEEILVRPELKALLVRGEGRHFSAGADLAALERQRLSGDLPAAIGRGKCLLDTLNRATVPVLAAIRGSCLGAGLEIALACHFRHAAPNALLGFPEAQHGFIPGMGGAVFGSAVLPASGLMELILSARLVLGTEALSLGLVDVLSEGADPEAEALEWLDRLTTRHRPALIRAALASIHDGRFLPRDQALANESARFFRLIQDASLHD
jgi:enoyl-CoA hydratase/carnithine racemase